MPDAFDYLKTALADRYAIERELGRGGMATVYLAVDHRHDRRVAVKVLRPELTWCLSAAPAQGSPSTSLGTDRFLREIKITAQLNHPHILPLLDSGKAEGLLYYIMPYVEGPSLRAKLAQEGRLKLQDALRILRDVVDGVAHAHANGVIHRDIKPENVLLSGRHAVVMDFGIAKAVSTAAGSGLTRTGVPIGTPAYMAPEQASGDREVSLPADIYSIGVLGYEMLTGRWPFPGMDTPRGLMTSKLSNEPDPITDHRSHVPSALARALMRCLEHNPADRWTSAQLWNQLEAVDTQNRPPAWWRASSVRKECVRSDYRCPSGGEALN